MVKHFTIKYTASNEPETLIVLTTEYFTDAERVALGLLKVTDADPVILRVGTENVVIHYYKNGEKSHIFDKL